MMVQLCHELLHPFEAWQFVGLDLPSLEVAKDDRMAGSGASEAAGWVLYEDCILLQYLLKALCLHDLLSNQNCDIMSIYGHL